MEIKAMREALRPIVDVVPRSNADVITLYEEKFPEEKFPVERPTYTYIGSGDEPPQITNFMGLQVFLRGQETEVTNPVVLEKIKHHPCFVAGPVDPAKLIENDQLAKKIAQGQRTRDSQIQLTHRKNHGDS
jgi:hypothetical protein